MPSECQVDKSCSSISVAYLSTIRSVAVWKILSREHGKGNQKCKWCLVHSINGV